MKNTCKKLFSLMLAVVLLVSVVPFQASATAIEGNVNVRFFEEATGFYKEWDYTATWTDGEVVKESDLNWYLEQAGLNNDYELACTDAIVVPDTDKSATDAYVVVYLAAKEKAPKEFNVNIRFYDGKSVFHEYNYTALAENQAPATADSAYLNLWLTDAGLADKYKATESEAIRVDYEDGTGNCYYVVNVEPKTTTPTTEVINLTVTVTGDKAYSKDLTIVKGETFTENWIHFVFADYANGNYEMVGEYGHSGNKYTVTVRKINTNNGGNGGNGDGDNSKNDNKVFLNIFMDGDFKNPKTVSIHEREQIAYDGYVSKQEVESVIMKYYKAKDSYGIDVDGIYIHTGNVMDKWQKNEKVNAVDNIYDLKAQGNVYLSVWIDNAVAKKASTADSSNPKTGDEIFVTVTIMAVTATALAGAYFFNKKRMAQ